MSLRLLDPGEKMSFPKVGRIIASLSDVDSRSCHFFATFSRATTCRPWQAAACNLRRLSVKLFYARASAGTQGRYQPASLSPNSLKTKVDPSTLLPKRILLVRFTPRRFERRM